MLIINQAWQIHGLGSFISTFQLLNMLPREDVQSLNLEAFKPQLDKAMADLFQCWR